MPWWQTLSLDPNSPKFDSLTYFPPSFTSFKIEGVETCLVLVILLIQVEVIIENPILFLFHDIISEKEILLMKKSSWQTVNFLTKNFWWMLFVIFLAFVSTTFKWTSSFFHFKMFWEQIYPFISSLHLSFDCFLCRFSTNGVYSEWTSPFHLRHRFVLYLAERFQ